MAAKLRKVPRNIWKQVMTCSTGFPRPLFVFASLEMSEIDTNPFCWPEMRFRCLFGSFCLAGNLWKFRNSCKDQCTSPSDLHQLNLWHCFVRSSDARYLKQKLVVSGGGFSHFWEFTNLKGCPKSWSTIETFQPRSVTRSFEKWAKSEFPMVFWTHWLIDLKWIAESKPLHSPKRRNPPWWCQKWCVPCTHSPSIVPERQIVS